MKTQSSSTVKPFIDYAAYLMSCLKRPSNNKLPSVMYTTQNSSAVESVIDNAANQLSCIKAPEQIL